MLYIQLTGFSLAPDKVSVDVPQGNASVVVINAQGKPCTCEAAYAPVCGANGRTYFSACFAKCDAITVTRQGACDASVVISNCGLPGGPQVIVGAGGGWQAGIGGQAGAAGQAGGAGTGGCTSTQ